MSEIDFLEAAPEYMDDEIEERENKKKIITKTIVPNLIHHLKLPDGKICYIIKDKGHVKTADNYKSNGQTYKPAQTLPFTYLEDVDVFQKTNSLDKKDLLDHLIQFFKEYIEFPHNQDYLIVALYVVHTWFIEHFSVTPILFIFGVKETGKTRTGELIYLTSFRGLRLTTPTEASLFRQTQYFKPTNIIDEIKLWGQDGNKAVADLLKSCYKRGILVPRINMNRSGEGQLEYFDVFTPIVICSTESMPPIIESRCIKIVMRQNISPDVERNINYKEASQIRKQLTILRGQYLDKRLPIIYENTARRRLKEITEPLVTICHIMDPERIPELIDFIQYEQMRIADEEGESLEAEIVKKIQELYDSRQERKFLTRDVTEAINRNKYEKDHYSDKYIAACISRLGFEKTRIHGGRHGYKYDRHLIERLLKQYQIEKEEPTEGVNSTEEHGFSID